MTSDPVEDVIKARGAPIWFQLYATNKWEVAAAITKRAENAGCTADGRHRRPQRRPQPGNPVPAAARATSATATAATTAPACRPRSRAAPMFKGVDITGLRNTQSSAMTWEFFKRMRDPPR